MSGSEILFAVWILDAVDSSTHLFCCEFLSYTKMPANKADRARDGICSVRDLLLVFDDKEIHCKPRDPRQRAVIFAGKPPPFTVGVFAAEQRRLRVRRCAAMDYDPDRVWSSTSQTPVAERMLPTKHLASFHPNITAPWIPVLRSSLPSRHVENLKAPSS
jgi:hypothetical protein